MLGNLSLSELKELADQKFKELKNSNIRKRLDDYKTALIDSKIPISFKGPQMLEADKLIDFIDKAKVLKGKTKKYYQDFILQISSISATVSSWEAALHPQPMIGPTAQPQSTTTQTQRSQMESDTQSQQTELTPLEQQRAASKRSRQAMQEPLLGNAHFWQDNYKQLIREYGISDQTQQQHRSLFPFKGDLAKWQEAAIAKFNELLSKNIKASINECLVVMDEIQKIQSSGVLKVTLDVDLYKKNLIEFLEVFENGMKMDGDIGYYKYIYTSLVNLDEFVTNKKPQLDSFIARRRVPTQQETMQQTPAHGRLWSNPQMQTTDTSAPDKKRKTSNSNDYESPTKKT